MRNKINFRLWDNECPEGSKMIYCSPLEACDNGLWFPFAGHNDDVAPVVMQSIGLHDKNAKLIYEGDVLRGVEGSKYQIVWSEYRAGFQIQRIEKKNKFDGRIGPMQTAAQKYIVEKMEILGNVFENNELLNS